MWRAMRPHVKRSLFPVQQVAEIMASRAAAQSFFPVVKILTKKKEEKVPILQLYVQPAAGPETTFFLGGP